MRKLFETNKRVTTIDAPSAQIILRKAHFIQCKQFLLWKISDNTIILSSKVLRMGIQMQAT